MKKLLVIAMISVFAVSAFAVDFSFTGAHEVKGVVAYETESEETTHYIYQEALIYGKAQLDAKTTFNFRAYLSDGDYGTTGAARGNNHFDRYWATYELMDGMKLTVGRTSLGLSSNTFLQNMWDIVHPYGNPTSDQIRVDYNVNNDVALYGSYVIRNESYTEIDTTLGFVGANMMFGDLKINPVLSFYTSPKGAAAATGIPFGGRQIAFGVAASYMPATGLQVEGGVALNKQMAEGVFNNDEKPMVFGAYADVAFVMDMLKAGGFVAYSSSDKDAEVGYRFSKNWDRTFIVDDGVGKTAADGDGGFAGFLQVGVYADFEVMSDLTLSAIVAYYMNMADTNAGGIILDRDAHEDAKILDIEVSAAYKLSDITTLSAGIGYAMASDIDINVDENYVVGFWKLRTEF